MHPNDERALLAGHYFDIDAADRLYNFFYKLLRVPNNLAEEERDDRDKPPSRRSATVPFELLHWWFRDVIGPIFGWKCSDGRRRFTKAFITTAKKSAKSTVLSGLPLYMMLADGEEEAECFSAATDRDQAGIIYRKANRMRSMSPSLSRVLKATESQKRIYHKESGSFYEAISSDADSADGANPHLIIVDELHRWKSRNFFDTLRMGNIQRLQPLFLMITTAGDDPSGICYEEYELAKRLDDPNDEACELSQHVVIKEAAPERSWDDPEGWIEANPSLLEGLGSVEALQKNCNEAKLVPQKRRYFTRTICNRWVDGGDDQYLDADSWKACGMLGNVRDTAFEPAAPFSGRPKHDLLPSHEKHPCAGGLDLSSLLDITALALAFFEPPFVDLMWWFWMPEERVVTATERDKVPYRDWIDEGWIETTPGNAVDYASIRRLISGVQLDEQGKPLPGKWDGHISRKYQIVEIGFDRWGGSKLVPELDQYDGVPMVEFGQGYASMSRPCKEFQAMVLNGIIRHGNNPVATWMSRNAVTDDDPAGNIKLSKKKARFRIDGIVAAVMATELCLNGEAKNMRMWEGASTGMWD